MTSVSGLLDAADLRCAGVARWGQKPPLFDPGVYLVATTSDPDDEAGHPTPAIDSAAVRILLQVRPEATVDGVAATEESVAGRLRALWVPGEPVVYIGLATGPVSDRVGQYYTTKIGTRAPHAGGWPLKMLANLDQLWVHYAAAADPAAAEQRLLAAFRAGLSDAVVAGLHDSRVVLPYANLELTKGARKAHGFTGVKAPRATPSATTTPTTPAQRTRQPRPRIPCRRDSSRTRACVPRTSRPPTSQPDGSGSRATRSGCSRATRPPSTSNSAANASRASGTRSTGPTRNAQARSQSARPPSSDSSLPIVR